MDKVSGVQSTLLLALALVLPVLLLSLLLFLALALALLLPLFLIVEGAVHFKWSVGKGKDGGGSECSSCLLYCTPAHRALPNSFATAPLSAGLPTHQATPPAPSLPCLQVNTSLVHLNLSDNYPRPPPSPACR